jgi:hypothetical protein
MTPNGLRGTSSPFCRHPPILASQDQLALRGLITAPKSRLKRGVLSHKAFHFVIKIEESSLLGMGKRGLFENVDPVLKEGVPLYLLSPCSVIMLYQCYLALQTE